MPKISLLTEFFQPEPRYGHTFSSGPRQSMAKLCPHTGAKLWFSIKLLLGFPKWTYAQNCSFDSFTAKTILCPQAGAKVCTNPFSACNHGSETISVYFAQSIIFIMHPLWGPKGRGVAPIGATRGCISIYVPFLVTICTGCVYLAGKLVWAN